jgi:hypothetical protein
MLGQPTESEHSDAQTIPASSVFVCHELNGHSQYLHGQALRNWPFIRLAISRPAVCLENMKFLLVLIRLCEWQLCERWGVWSHLSIVVQSVWRPRRCICRSRPFTPDRSPGKRIGRSNGREAMAGRTDNCCRQGDSRGGAGGTTRRRTGPLPRRLPPPRRKPLRTHRCG